MNVKEYGSEFWITNDDLLGNYQENDYILGPEEIYFANGRSCVSHLLDSISTKYMKAILPSYICKTVVKPFVLKGYKVLFYDSDRKLKPNIDEIAELIGGEPSIILHMGYFGFITNEGVKDIKSLIERTDSIVLEDRAHTLFSKTDSFSDAEFTSLRKWIGIPGGGLINPISNIFHFRRVNDIFKTAYEIRLESLRLKAIYIKTGEITLRERYKAGFEKAERLMDENSTVYRSDDVSITILKHLNKKRLIERRRMNYRVLLKNLSNNERFSPIFNTLPENVCPMFFPIYVNSNKERDSLQREFASKNLFCPIHWPRNVYSNANHKEYKYIISHILSIPCDQRYSEADMNRIVKIVSC